MYSFEYQSKRAEFGKRLSKEHAAESSSDSCCNFLFMGIFKNLIHIFMVVFCISFGGMIFIIEEDSDDMKLDDD